MQGFRLVPIDRHHTRAGIALGRVDETSNETSLDERHVVCHEERLICLGLFKSRVYSSQRAFIRHNIFKNIYPLDGDRLADIVHIRGPYGNSFPVEKFEGKDIYFIAGGIGLPPLRSVINTVFARRQKYGAAKIIYGAKTPDELCFKEELKRWQKIPQTEVLITVDEADKKWDGNVGVVTTLWDKTEITGRDSIACVCGPPVMIKFVVEKLTKSAFDPKNVYVTLERYMKCGIGKCGHCNIAEKFVCIDGPVFSLEEISSFPAQEEVF